MTRSIFDLPLAPPVRLANSPRSIPALTVPAPDRPRPQPPGQSRNKRHTYNVYQILARKRAERERVTGNKEVKL